MNRYLIVLLLTVLCMRLFAQNRMVDVLYLKNGSILRGNLTERDTLGQYKIEIYGGSLFVVSETEVDSIKCERTAATKQSQTAQKIFYRNDRGYMNMTEFGFIYGTNLKTDNTNYSPDDFGMSVHSVNGYRHWIYLFTGAGVGIDRYVTYKQTFSPFYIRLQCEPLKKKTTPYAFADVGYSVMWKQKGDEYMSIKNKGGIYFAAGGGVRIYTPSRASVILSISYKRQHSTTVNTYNYEDGPVYTYKRQYQRLSVNVGVAF